MKNIKYIIAFLSLALVFNACEEETYEFGDLTAPTNLQVTVDIVGSDVDPLGDGSGVVNLTITADNALAYKFSYNGSDSNAPTSTKSFSFKSQLGPLGTFAVSKHLVNVIAYGTGGATTSKLIEVEVLCPNVPPPVIIEDFEEAVKPALGTFGPDPHYIAIMDNPDASGINESTTVVEYIKPSGSADWAGLFFNNGSLDMDVYSQVSLKVRSTKGKIKMLFKMENVDNTISYEKEGSIVGGDKWEEITFDFSDAPAAEYTKIVLFFDIWNVGDDSTYYFDDIKLFN